MLIVPAVLVLLAGSAWTARSVEPSPSVPTSDTPRLTQPQAIRIAKDEARHREINLAKESTTRPQASLTRTAIIGSFSLTASHMCTATVFAVLVDDRTGGLNLYWCP